MAPPFELEIVPLSEESKKIAEQELRETPENVENALKELRELLKNDSTIYYKDDDETLITFLRPCKFYAKSAYELVSFFFTIYNKLTSVGKKLIYCFHSIT
jgi:retinaldehyde-binding protein 1